MKKVLKIAGGIIGGYAVLNTLVLAWVGSGRVLKHRFENPDETQYELYDTIFDETTQSWKPYVELFKRLF